MNLMPLYRIIHTGFFIIYIFVNRSVSLNSMLKFDDNVQNIIVNNQSVYIAGTNFVQRLSQNLDVIARFSTGPEKDNPYCLYRQSGFICPDGRTINETDSYNTVLMFIQNPKGSLLVCSNIYAACKFLSLDTLEDLYKGRRFLSITSAVKDADVVATLANFGDPRPLIVAKSAGIAQKLDSKALSAIAAYQLIDDSRLLQEYEIDGEDIKIPYSETIFNKVNKVVLEAKYDISYITIFSINSFYYVVSVQQNLQSLQKVSKIIRFKFTADTFGDYIEQPLLCQKGDKVYNEMKSASYVKLNSSVNKWFSSVDDYLLFGLFASSSDPNDQVICYWKMNEVDSRLDAQRSKCSSGINIPWAPYLLDYNERCTKEVVQLFNLRLAPNEEIQGKLLLNIKGVRLGCLTTLVHERGLSLYISAEKHMLKRYAVMPDKAHQYSEQQYSGDHIFTKIVIDPTNKLLFMISKHHVVKAIVDDCSSRKSCYDCLSGPYCGWCTLSKQCTQITECENPEKLHYYISKDTDACPKVFNINPDKASITTVSKISFEATNIPDDVKYQCMVNDIELGIDFEAGKFTCGELDFTKIKPYNPVNGFAKVDVNLVSFNKAGNKIKLATSHVTVYSCEEFKSCKLCITGQFPCGWCPNTLTCHEKADSCSDSTSWVKYQGVNSTTYIDVCPNIIDTSTKQVSYDTDTEIILNAKGLAFPIGKFIYGCVFLFDGITLPTSATYISDTQVKCSKVKLNYKLEVASLVVEVKLMYGDINIDSQGTVTLLAYKCHVNRLDCSICLTAPVDWSCGWCLSSTRCSVKETCDTQPLTWSNDKCPVPVIKHFQPTEVAIGGGTTIEISGTDFGLTSDDIVGVTLAGAPCKILPKGYKISQRVLCITSPVSDNMQGKVVITVNSTGGRILNGTSMQDFFYRSPEIDDVFPLVGPCSGGTVIHLVGKYLHVGNTVIIEVNNEPCSNLKRNSTNISCETTPSVCLSARKRKRRAVSSLVEIFFDGYQVDPVLGAVQYTYVVDPVIGIVYTNKKSIFLQTYKSGGQLFRVEGQRFNAVQKPQMMFQTFNPPVLRKSICDVKHPSYMTCLAPNMSGIHVKKEGTIVLLGFEMDKIASIRSLRNLTVYPDPIFDSFPGDDKIFTVKDTDLVLTGRFFEVLSSDDVNVTVGGLPCIVTDLDQRLGCTLPKKEDVLAVANEPVPVKVVIGEEEQTFDIGFIKYHVAMEENQQLIYILIAVAFVLVLLIALIVLIVWYRRRKRKEKEYEQLVQIKLDRMESQYARAAKETFAAYQTEITDLTKDIELAEPQYLDFRQYAMRVLYPGMASHPILESNRDESDEWENCMVSFIKLLKEKDFLLAFIRTLENQSSFQMTDRCMVASLLSVSLQDDLKYVTEILMVLLTDLINKAGSSKHPKLLLRRTESVAEKLLTNWLAYTLHGFLNENVGDPLFKLFAAITTLIDKEPVDAITCDARNSLSEDKLLRQKIEFNVITINVEFIYTTNAGVYDSITVLTCDTISQTKEKIIKHIFVNKPYSEWPLPGDLQLGFTSPNGACLQLKDEDPTNIVEGDWKKINTLEHYKVPENSCMRLEPITEANLNQSNSFANTGTNQVVTSPRLSKFQSSRRKFNSSSARSMQDLDQSQKGLVHENSMGSIFQPSHASTPMLHNNHHDHREPKLWHMAKQTDYPQEQKEDAREVMAEVYLTRLLKTKETLHRFVDGLLNSIFGVNETGQRVIPPAVKYLFDFLDEQAEQLEIENQEVHHTWKNNSLPLRFWINMIKNPNFVFDINKSNTADSCLSVIAQLFMDSCSPDVHRLGKDSPANKLLYAKEIPEYKKLVQRFYTDVSNSALDEESFFRSLDVISTKYGNTFNSCNAASELMTYAIKYKVKIWDNLEDSGFQEHADKLQDIMENIPDD